MDDIFTRIRRMGLEATSHYNDGWVMGGYKKQLLEIRDYINNLFPDEEQNYSYSEGLLNGPGMDKIEENPNQLKLFEDEG